MSSIADEMVERKRPNIAPDLAVLLVRPDDPACDVGMRVQDWLRQGSRLVWVLNRERRWLYVYRAGDKGSIYYENGYIDGEDVLPGFRCQIKELFEPPAGVATTSPS